MVYLGGPCGETLRSNAKRDKIAPLLLEGLANNKLANLSLETRGHTHTHTHIFFVMNQTSVYRVQRFSIHHTAAQQQQSLRILLL